MKIAVLGAGAMGALFGGYLSRSNQVLLVDVNPALVQKISADGIHIYEPDGSHALYHPTVATAVSAAAEPADLVIVFVKAMFSDSALETNRALIGPDTFLMTLQNGSGHEETLLRYVDRAHVIIGTTQHNSAVRELGVVRHGGSGQTHIGCLEGPASRLKPIADVFTACGLATDCREDVQKLIWEKLFTNVSASVLTAVLQVPLGFIVDDSCAWELCERLIREAVAVANTDGMDFDPEEKIAEVRAVCENSPAGVTSICADLCAGRRTEVDAISGSVVRASRYNGTPAPTHEAMVCLIHALERRPPAVAGPNN